jgi:hypothetical protein
MLGKCQLIFVKPYVPYTFFISRCQISAGLANVHFMMALACHSLTQEAANCAATQELPSILWNPEVHMSPPPVPILSQIDPIPTIPSYLSKIHFNIVTWMVKAVSSPCHAVPCRAEPSRAGPLRLLHSVAVNTLQQHCHGDDSTVLATT